MGGRYSSATPPHCRTPTRNRLEALERARTSAGSEAPIALRLLGPELPQPTLPDGTPWPEVPPRRTATPDGQRSGPARLLIGRLAAPGTPVGTAHNAGAGDLPVRDADDRLTDDLDTLPWLFVADLTHFLDLPEDAPGPARRLAEHLAAIVRAATAGDVGTGWTSALPCRRRPGQPALPGPDHRPTARNAGADPMAVQRLRRPGRDQQLAGHAPRPADPDAERLVFRIRAHPDGAAATDDDDELEELIGFVAAEANHEPNRRRQRRVDTAFGVLNDALATMDGMGR